MASLDIQGFTYEPRFDVLAGLSSLFADCGGWVTERKTLSPARTEFVVEIQLRSVLDLYGGLMATGLELTRPAHEILTELCTRSKYRRVASRLGQVVSLRLAIQFLEDATMHSLLVDSVNASG